LEFNYQNAVKKLTELINVISLDQFTSYLRSIDNLSELKYVFNAAKINTSGARTAMRDFIFDSNRREIIYNSLKNSLKNELDIETLNEFDLGKITKIVNGFVIFQ
jgi:hypothetical protein